MVLVYLRYLSVLTAGRLVENDEDVDDGARVSTNPELNRPAPLISKSSTLKVFEIRRLSVARNVMPTSPTVFGLSTSPLIAMKPSVNTLGGASWPVMRVRKFVAVKFSA